MFVKFLDLQLTRHCISTGNDKFLSDFCEQHNMIDNSSRSEDNSSLSQSRGSDTIMVEQLKNISCPVSKIDASKKPYHILSPPCKERCYNGGYFESNVFITLSYSYRYLYTILLSV